LKVNPSFLSPDLSNQPRESYQIIGEVETPLGDVIPTKSLKSTEMRGIESLPSSTKNLGFQPKLVNRSPIQDFEKSTSYTQMHKTSTHDLLQEIREKIA
jgi:hypothetical protein